MPPTIESDSFKSLSSPKVGHFDMVADHQEVFRLDVEVLQAVPLMNEVERVGRVADVAEQLIAGNARHAGLTARVEPRFETALGQFRDDDQAAVDDFDPFDREQERMPDLFDAIERFQFALGAGLVEPAVDELDRLAQPARDLGFPDLTVAAAAQTGTQHVAGNRLVLQRGVRRSGSTLTMEIKIFKTVAK